MIKGERKEARSRLFPSLLVINPITNYQLPITHYQLPITHYPFPPKNACQYSRRILAILVTEIPLGQTASHSQ
jgi:hypothetical protein